MKFFLTFLLLALPVHAEEKSRTIIFFGDSITAGYGLNPNEAYPVLIQNKIDAAKFPYRVVNAGLSGDTTTAGEQRLRWILRQKADVLVLALGGNDGLRGIPTETTRKNLQKMIDYARTVNPNIKIVLGGMQMPPNYGKVYTEKFAAIFPALAQKNNVHLVPFLLEGVGGVAKMNQPDRVHPTAEGQAIVANNVWKVLEPLLSSL